MDWIALGLSLKLGIMTILVLVPLAILAARWLAYCRFPGKPAIEALLAVPLVLPPTVVGYYLLVGLGSQSWLGQWLMQWTGHLLVFHFSGLLIASIIVNIPFAVQPIQRGFESIPQEVRDAAACCGMSRLRTLLTVELPLAWPGILTAIVLTFAHTLGEFGVVLMLGGNLPGRTRTVSVAIYDQVQSLDYAAANRTAGVLVALSFALLALTYHAQREGAFRWPTT